MDDSYQIFEQASLRHCPNTGRARRSTVKQVLEQTDIDMAVAEISQWPGYQSTPLHALKPLATSTGVAAIYYKDEASRFGLGSFKALGGAYAVLCQLRQQLEQHLGQPVSFADIRSGRYRDQSQAITVTTATDGNHGRSVAWGAQQFGCPCVIFIHAGVSEFRQQAMQAYGARVIRIDGNYDDSVRAAAESASEHGWFVISDTSYPGYTAPPKNVMAGYGVMMQEIMQQLGDGPALTHVFIQGGVGGLAGAVAACLWQHEPIAMPRIIVVEPELADCLYQSAVNQRPTAVEIGEETLMAGLSCGEVSMLGWQILEQLASHFLTIPEALVGPSMKLLGRSPHKIIAGESAIAGLAGLLAAARQPALCEAIELDENSRVLVLGTEGATDPAIYKNLTGIDPG